MGYVWQRGRFFSLALHTDGQKGSHRTIDRHALKIPAPQGESTLAENVLSPFHAEPRQCGQTYIKWRKIATALKILGSIFCVRKMGLANAVYKLEFKLLQIEACARIARCTMHLSG